MSSRRRWRRLALRFLLILMLLAVALPTAAWLTLRASLPQYDGVVNATALSDRVIVERDALGTATIRAGSRRDADWALGYVHAQERFFQMDLMRRRSAGELAELFGPVALPADRIARAHRMRARLHDALATLPDDQRAALDAYRDGVNAGLAALSARPFPYLLTQTAPAPWRDEDSLLVIAAMTFTLEDAGNDRERPQRAGGWRIGGAQVQCFEPETTQRASGPNCRSTVTMRTASVARMNAQALANHPR